MKYSLGISNFLEEISSLFKKILVQGQEQWPRGATSRPRSAAAAQRSYPTFEVRGHGREEQPHVQGAVAAWEQEGLEELLHVPGQKGQP